MFFPPLLCDALSDVSSASEDDAEMKAYAYVYRYNGLGECIWKRLPGCSPVTMQYDVHRRMVLSQDGNQVLSGEWTSVWYDGLGRPCVMSVGSLPYSGDVSGTEFTASYSGEPGSTYGYRLSPELPSGAQLVSVSYFDNYDFIELAPESCRDSLRAYVQKPVSLNPKPSANLLIPPIKDSTILTPVPLPELKLPVVTTEFDRYGNSRMTGRVVWTVGDACEALYSSCYYDERGLVIQSHSQNHLGGWETEKILYSFTGKPISRTLSHTVGTVSSVSSDSRPDTSGVSNPLVEHYTYTYDNMDRPLKVIHCLGSANETVMSDNSYDNLGRLASDVRNGAAPMRTSYAYNIRSWQTCLSSDIFSEELHYDDPASCGASSSPRFDGSISASVHSFGSGMKCGYGYSYDGLGRVANTGWLSGGTAVYGYGTSYSYDDQGNVLSVSRECRSDLSDGDNLMMAYSGNRLYSMSDHGESMIPDFLAGSIPSGMTQYSYDANGNMTRDLNSGLTLMSYNRMNLPEDLICVASDGIHNIRYLYSPDGVKLRVSVSGPDGTSDVTDYASNVVYRNGSVERILVPGGYIMDGNYRFFVTDHLGSIRAVADSEGNVLETIDYYPYGQEISDGTALDGNGTAALDETLQPYRFNGKESQSFAGLPYLDYGARFYHPQSTRWTTMDPLAEKYYFLSPYAFCSNNPVNFVDWNGEDWYIFSSSGQYVKKVEMDGQHRIVIYSTETLESGETYDHYRFVDFADPENDPQSIDNGEIDKITQISEDEIYNQLINQGISGASMVDFYNESGGGGAFDYYASVISTHYSEADTRLYLPEGESVAHNAMNYGNFLWGMTGYIIGFPTIILRLGAHYNSYFDPHKGNGYNKQWDSKDDQLSIKKGALYAKTHKLKKR